MDCLFFLCTDYLLDNAEFGDSSGVSVQKTPFEERIDSVFREVTPANQSASAGQGVNFHESIIGQLINDLKVLDFQKLEHMSSVCLTSNSTGGLLLWQSPALDNIRHALDGLLGMACLASGTASMRAADGLGEFVLKACQFAHEVERNPQLRADFASADAFSKQPNSESEDEEEREETSRSQGRKSTNGGEASRRLEQMKQEACESFFGVHMPLQQQLLSMTLRVCVPLLTVSMTHPSAASTATLPADLRRSREQLVRRISDAANRFNHIGIWTPEEGVLEVNRKRCEQRRRLLVSIMQSGSRRRPRNSTIGGPGGSDDEADRPAPVPAAPTGEEDEQPLAVLKEEDWRREVESAGNVWLSLLQSICAASLDKQEWRVCAANSCLSVLRYMPRTVADPFAGFLSRLLSTGKASRRAQAVETLHLLFSDPKMVQWNILNVNAAVEASLEDSANFAKREKRLRVLGKARAAKQADRDAKLQAALEAKRVKELEAEAKRKTAEALADLQKRMEEDSEEDETNKKRTNRRSERRTGTKKRVVDSDGDQDVEEKLDSGEGTPFVNTNGAFEESEAETADEEDGAYASDEGDSSEVIIARFESSLAREPPVISVGASIPVLLSLCSRAHDSVSTVRTRAVLSVCKMFSLIDAANTHVFCRSLGLPAALGTHDATEETIRGASSVGVTLLPGAVGVNVRQLFSHLAADERATNRKAALALFDDVTPLVFHRLRVSISSVFRLLFPMETLRSLVEDSALAVRKQAMISLTDLMRNNPSADICKNLWLTLAIPCLLDAESSVAEATLDAVNSNIFTPITSARSRGLGLETQILRNAIAVLKAANEDAAELFQRSIRSILKKEPAIAADFCRGLENVASMDLQKVHVDDMSPEQIESEVSQWNAGVWALVEETVGVGKGSFSLDFLLSAWRLTRQAAMSCARRPLDPEVVAAQVENGMKPVCSTPVGRQTSELQASSSLRTKGGSNVSQVIDDIKHRSERAHYVCVIGRRVLSALTTLLENMIAAPGSSSAAAQLSKKKSEIRDMMGEHLKTLDLPAALLQKVVNVYCVLAVVPETASKPVPVVSSVATRLKKTPKKQRLDSSDESSSDGEVVSKEPKSIAAKVAALQREADKKKRVGDTSLSGDLDFEAEQFIQTLFGNSTQRLGEFVLKMKSLKESAGASILPSTPSSTGRGGNKNIDVQALANDVEDVCRHLEVVGLVPSVCGGFVPIPKPVPLICNHLAADALLPPRLRAHAVWALGRVLVAASAIPTSAASKSTPNVVTKAIVGSMASAISLLTRPANPAVVRNAALVVLCDLCRFASGAGVEAHVETLSETLADAAPLLRKQSLWMLSQLASEDFVKLTARSASSGPLVWRMVSCVADEVDVIRHFAEVFVQRVALPKTDKLIVHGLVELVCTLNGVSNLNSKPFPGSSSSSPFCLLEQPEKRETIYLFLMSQLKEIEKKDLSQRLVNAFLALFVDSKDEHSKDTMVQLPKSATSPLGSALRDVLRLLSCREMRVAAKVNSAVSNAKRAKEDMPEAAANDPETAAAAEGGVFEQLLSATKANLAQDILPVLLSLKRVMEQQNSPLLGEVRHCIADLLGDFSKQAVAELLPGDRLFAREVEQMIDQRQQEHHDESEEGHQIKGKRHSLSLV